MDPFTDIKNEKWFNPTRGYLTFDEAMDYIKDYTVSSPNDIKNFIIAIGTDSQQHGNTWKFTTSIAVRRMIDDTHGRGGIFFVRNEYYKHIGSIRQKIVTEAGITVSLAEPIAYALLDRGVDADIRLHFDINERGESRIALREVKNMAMGTGFPFSIKPFAWGASGVSDRYSK